MKNFFSKPFGQTLLMVLHGFWYIFDWVLTTFALFLASIPLGNIGLLFGIYAPLAIMGILATFAYKHLRNSTDKLSAHFKLFMRANPIRLKKAKD